MGGLWKGPTPLLFVMVPAGSTASIAWLPRGSLARVLRHCEVQFQLFLGWQGTAARTTSRMYMLHVVTLMIFFVIHLLTSSIVVVVIVVVDIIVVVVVVVVYYR